MARLLVLRGETPDHEIELIRFPLRIGRGPQNDVVLDDPAKSVSRDHAEIRFEGGRYMLVDLESQNGVWVGGNRVPYVALEPNVVATIGRFRLTIESDAASATSVIGPVVGGSDPRTEHVPPAAHSGTGQRPPARVSEPTRAPARKWTREQKWAVLAASTIAAVGVIAMAAFLVRPSSSPERPVEEVTKFIALAIPLINQGACVDALRDNIEPGLALDPGNGELLALKRRAEECAEPTPPPAPPGLSPVEVGAALERAKALIAQRDCPSALGIIGDVLNANPDDAEARELKMQAEACSQPVGSKPRPPAEPAPQLAQRVSSDSGGLEPLPGELDRDYQMRVKAMRARYDEAILIASKGPSRRAITAFEAIVHDATPKYLDISAKLVEARRAWRATAEPLMSEARALVAKEMWDEAIRKFNEAHDVDPALSIDAEVRSAEAQKLAAGQEECKLGRQTISYNHPVGIQHFRRALTLLPPDDPCYLFAKRYVSEPGK